MSQQKSSQSGITHETFFSISNLLSLGRLFLTIPTCLVLWYGSKEIAVSLFVLAALTDYLDGWFARKLDQVSHLGKILDPLADKIYIAGVVITMLIQGTIPLWLVLPVLARDLLILLGGIYIRHTKGIVLPSNWTGKWAVGALSLTLLVIYLGGSGVPVTLLIILTFVMLGLSLFLYSKRMVQRLGSEKLEVRS